MDLFSGIQEVSRRVMVARGARSEFIELSGQRLHHFDLKGSGKGPPIVLVHGLGGSAAGFSRVFFRLARRFERVLAVDLPGHGFSPEYGLGPTSVRGLYDMLVAYCRHLGLWCGGWEGLLWLRQPWIEGVGGGELRAHPPCWRRWRLPP